MFAEPIYIYIYIYIYMLYVIYVLSILVTIATTVCHSIPCIRIIYIVCIHTHTVMYNLK